jgi:hypothetical protein
MSNVQITFISLWVAKDAEFDLISKIYNLPYNFY